MIETTPEEDARTEMLLRELFRLLEDQDRNPFDLLAAEAAQSEPHATVQRFLQARDPEQRGSRPRDRELMIDWLTGCGWPDDPYRAPRMTAPPTPTGGCGANNPVENIEQLRAATEHAEQVDWPEVGNAARAQRGGYALVRYTALLVGDQQQVLRTALADLLGDLMHLADALDVDYDDAHQRAAEHHRAETAVRD
jgi:hypothetical protein